MDHKEIVKTLKERGLDHKDAAEAAGLVIQERMNARIRGYKSGFNDGYEKGSKEGLPQVDLNHIPHNWSLEKFTEFYREEGFVLIDPDS